MHETVIFRFERKKNTRSSFQSRLIFLDLTIHKKPGETDFTRSLAKPYL